MFRVPTHWTKEQVEVMVNARLDDALKDIREAIKLLREIEGLIIIGKRNREFSLGEAWTIASLAGRIEKDAERLFMLVKKYQI